MITFQVDKVVRGEAGAFERAPIADGVKAMVGLTPEACGADAPGVIGDKIRDRWYVNGYNALVGACHLAYQRHYPLVLSPDAIWLAIEQGFARHVDVHAEKLRRRFVAHEGKKYIEIQRDNFVKGDAGNDWPGAFAEFSERIGAEVGPKKVDLLVGRFSTTGPIERAASEVVLMDAMSHYFAYGERTLCGIPEVTLTGTEDDWRQIRERARALSEYECADWTRALDGALAHFVAAFAGSADPKFWGNFYKTGGGSGGPFINGMINVFFPYLVTSRRGEAVSYEPNPMATKPEAVRGQFGGITTDRYPQGLASVPMKWHYHDQTFDMRLCGGFVGVDSDDQTGAVRPVIAWAVADASAQVER